MTSNKRSSRSAEAVAASHSAGATMSGPLTRIVRRVTKFVQGLLFDHAYSNVLFAIVMLAELILGITIIQRIACE